MKNEERNLEQPFLINKDALIDFYRLQKYDSWKISLVFFFLVFSYQFDYLKYLDKLMNKFPIIFFFFENIFPYLKSSALYKTTYIPVNYSYFKKKEV